MVVVEVDWVRSPSKPFAMDGDDPIIGNAANGAL